MKRSKFSLSHYKLLTCDMGELVPIGLTEVLPGDTVQQATSLLVRVSPLVSPVMHPVHVRVHHWFVPNRLVWAGWEDFITGGPDGMNSDIVPSIANPNVEGGLGDYLGLVPGAGGLVNAMPFRAYALIWNEWYRDQDLQTELPISTASGTDTTTPTSLQHCAWEKDYFTSARPWTQKGPEVTIPFGVTAEVVSNGRQPKLNVYGQVTDGPLISGDDGLESALRVGGATTTQANVAWGSETGLQTDLMSATAVNVNEFRRAFALQRYEEARARYGSRYTEYLRYLGVRSSDARLQRPEYLGGGKQTIQFSEVLQTGPGSTDGSPVAGGVGQLAGHGIGAMRSNRYRKFFEEHGYIISLLSVKPKTMYMTSMARHWLRKTKEDYFQRELQHIGQQPIWNAEVHATHANPTGTFGYQDRYDEYRRAESTVAGDFRHDLDFWHYARSFASDPVLNADFIKAVPTKRVNQVQTEDVLWIMANHSIQARRMVAAAGKSFIF